MASEEFYRRPFSPSKAQPPTDLDLFMYASEIGRKHEQQNDAMAQCRIGAHGI